MVHYVGDLSQAKIDQRLVAAKEMQFQLRIGSDEAHLSSTANFTRQVSRSWNRRNYWYL